MSITVSKELLINLGSFSNIKVIAAITANDDNWEIAWKEINQQILEQETIEKANRLPKSTDKKDWKPVDEMPF